MESKGIKIFLATPAYSGKVNAQYAVALAETKNLLTTNGMELFIHINCSGSLLIAERNRLIKNFMDSDCTHMLCVDHDLAWPPMAVVSMINHNVDFVGGVYPSRQGSYFYFRPKLNPDGSLVSNGYLIGGEYISAGFMLIKREVIQKMMDVLPQLKFSPKQDSPNNMEGYAFFNTELFEGEFWGEDFVFCRNVKKAGFDIWVDPYIEFDHDGSKGMLRSVLTETPKE